MNHNRRFSPNVSISSKFPFPNVEGKSKFKRKLTSKKEQLKIWTEGKQKGEIFTVKKFEFGGRGKGVG